MPEPRTHNKKRASNINDFIDSIANLARTKEDEFEQWKRCEPIAAKGSEHARNPIKY